ncbi:hypothetical protein SAMN02982997_02305 [Legionella micdadei]|uniref:Uncharacterized protein n=1 Tax=Legionella micdadei TaxID=451 RepID=A0A1G5HJD4_LEGMI|nr:hypothetical protein Lmic_0352 [Legionella micdadei]SCY63420.1 hypothetical protein SAMN02982997_02305 [Legionella micdadei]
MRIKITTFSQFMPPLFPPPTSCGGGGKMRPYATTPNKPGTLRCKGGFGFLSSTDETFLF